MYSIKLSFNSGSFKNGAEAFSFIVNYLPFAPRFIKSTKSFSEGYNDFNKEKVSERFEENDDFAFTITDDLYIYEDELNALFYREDAIKFVQYFIFSFETLNELWFKTLVDAAHKKGFFEAYYTHKYKTQYQDQIFFDEFMKAKPASDLVLKMHWHPIYSEIYKEEVIDIFQNPGHQLMTYGTWLMAAPEMWFSKQAWQYFSKERIIALDKTVEVRELAEGLLYVKLFDATIADYETKEILTLQAYFREHSGMNEVEKILEELCNTQNKEAGNAENVIIKKINIDESGMYSEEDGVKNIRKE
jgi:hypothetical protein